MAKRIYSFKTLDDPINFGRLYLGEPIGQVMRSNSDYIDWCIKNFKPFKLYKKLFKQFKQIKQEKLNGI